jgi:hypothetical protein
MRIAAHQTAGHIAVSNEQEAGREFVFTCRFNGNLNLSMFSRQPHMVSGRKAEPLHIFWRYLQGIDFTLVIVARFSLAISAT